MKVKRTLLPEHIQHIIATGEVEIELTAEEMRLAYLEEQHDNRLSDAEWQFQDYFHSDYEISEEADAEARFVRDYGITPDEVKNPASPHYLLEKAVATFAHNHDCNNADNDAWRVAIIDTLEQYSGGIKHRCPRCGHVLIASDLPEYTYLCSFCDENFFMFEAVDVNPERGGADNG